MQKPVGAWKKKKKQKNDVSDAFAMIHRLAVVVAFILELLLSSPTLAVLVSALYAHNYMRQLLRAHQTTITTTHKINNADVIVVVGFVSCEGVIVNKSLCFDVNFHKQ